MWLRQSTAGQEILLGPFLDDTDGKTAETALTIANTDIKLWKEGGTTESNKNSGGATHIAGGRYYAVLDATDTNTLGNFEVNVHVSGALPVRRSFVVLPANVYDSLVLGTDALQVDAIQLSGTTQTARDIGASVLLSSGTGTGQISLSSGAVTVGTNNDKTGYSLSQSFPANFASMAITVGGAVTVGTNNDKTGYSLTQSFPTNFASLSITAGGLVDITQAAADKAWSTTTRILTANTNLNDPTAAQIADAVWDEAIADHLGAGSTGNALNSASSAGDPWSTSLPGAYGAGTAGYIIGNNVNATISSRATQTSVDTIDGYLDTEIAAIKTKTDNLPASPAATGDIPSAATIADAVWDEARAGHVSAGSFGEGVASVQGNVTGSVASVTAGVTVTTNNDKTGYSISGTKTTLDALNDITAAQAADAVWDESTTGHTTAGTFGEQVKTDIDAILADTNELQTDWANGGRLDNILDARAAQTTADAIETDTQDIQNRLPAALTGGGNMKADVIAVSSSTSAADNLEAHALRSVSVTFSAGGTTTTAVLNQVDGAAASSTDDVYNGRVLIFSAPSALKDQACTITDYVGSTKTATISAVTASVDATATAILV